MNIIESIIDFVYPPICPICKEIIPWYSEKRICKNCREAIPIIEGPRCEKCSKIIDHEENILCFDCSKKAHVYNKGWSLCLYQEPLKEAIYAFKYNNKKEYGKLFAKEIVNHFKSILIQYKIDVIIPIPLYYKKKKKRGYNQSEVLAKEIGKMLDIKVECCLERVRDTKAQKGLNDEQRIKNLRNAISLKNNRYSFKKILLVDDIYTTGSTINACARALKKNIHNDDIQVYFISLCIGKGY
ncbi:MAG: ComF family protein [Eubacteriales bacterium]